MKCVICKQGKTHPGLTTVTLEREQAVVIFKQVPADICENCGESYLDNKVAGDLLKKAEIAVSSGAEVEIRRYAA